MVTRSDEESFDVELPPQPNPAVAIKNFIASRHGGKAKGGKVKSQRSVVLPVPNTTTIATNREEDESTETQAGEVERGELDTEEDESFQPRVRKRSFILRSDEEDIGDENETADIDEPEPRTIKKSKAVPKRKSRKESDAMLDKYNIYVHPEDSKHIIATNEYVKRIQTLMKASTRIDAQKTSENEKSRKEHILNTLRNAIRIMRYMAPNHVIGDFRWGCLANGGKLTELFNTLKHELSMAPNTISNYHKALDFLFKGAKLLFFSNG